MLIAFAILSTTTVLANDGNDAHHTPPAPSHKIWSSEDARAASSQGGSHGQGFWGDLWDSIKSLFGHHHHSNRPTPGDHGNPPPSSFGDGNTAGGAPCPPGGSSAPAGPSGPGSPSVPIDGGLSILLAAGVGLGVKKARDSYKAAHS